MKAVLLLSGGLDSAVCAYLLRALGTTIHALSVDYGQRHRRELDDAVSVADAVGAASHAIVTADVFPRSPLTSGPADTSCIVAGRNRVLLSIAASHAEHHEADTLVIGCNRDDATVYADCRPAFLDAFEAMLRQQLGSTASVFAPLSGMTKAHVVRVGAGLGVPFARTWSCYDPKREGRPCGVCGACTTRAGAFAAANIADSLLPSGAWFSAPGAVST